MDFTHELFFQIRDISAFKLQDELGVVVTSSSVSTIEGRSVSFYVKGKGSESHEVSFEFDRDGKLVSVTKDRKSFTGNILSATDASDLVRSVVDQE